MAYYNVYGRRFFGEFDSIPRNGGQSDYYYFYISKRNEVDNIQSVTCAEKPAVHSWLDDDAKPYLKGSELSINLLNIDNQLPLSTFYSEYDDDWKIDFYVRYDNGSGYVDKLLFSGYLVQDECQEILVDHAHEIELTFTDGLGLLKDLKFVEALKQTPKIGTNVKSFSTYIQTVQDQTLGILFIRLTNPQFTPAIGESLLVDGVNIGNGVYTINRVVVNGNFVDLYVNEELPNIALTQIVARILDTYKTTELLFLLDLVWICIFNTGIRLNFGFASGMFENSEIPPVNKTRMLEYIKIAADTFVDNNDSDSLDAVFNKLNYRFGATIMQSDGMWCLVRWQELRNYTNVIKADFYNDNFVWQNRGDLTRWRNLGNMTDIQEGILGSIERPLKNLTHTYNYSQNDNIPFNGDFKDVGRLLREYTSGTDTIKEYFANGWQSMWPPATSLGWAFVDRYIRVVYNEFGNETDRYLVIDTRNTGISDDGRSVASDLSIEMNQGDKLKISFELRTAGYHNGTGFANAAMPGLTTNPGSQFSYWYVNQDGTWQNAIGSFGVSFIDNWNEWQTATVETKPIPFDGLAYIMVPFIHHPNETISYIKNVSIEYFPYLAGSFDIDSQAHHTYIPPFVKNNEDEEIYIDDSVKNYSKGTLFLTSQVGLLNNRTLKWQDGILGQDFRLGEIITRQEHLWRNKIRTKLEGSCWPVVKDNSFLSQLNVFEWFLKENSYFIFGKLDIDYKLNQADFTAFEMWNVNETPYDSVGVFPNIDLIPIGILKDRNLTYEFKYIKK